MALPFILKFIREKQLKGHSLLILICGETNSGKSMLGLWLASWIYKQFDVYKNLYFDVDRFLIHLYVSRKEVLTIDEANKHLDSLKWWDDFNNAFSMALNTQREKNNLYIVILPLAKRLASQHRDMTDVLIVMRNPGVADTYIIKKKFGEFRDIELKPIYVGRMFTPMPKDYLVQDYKDRETGDKDRILIEGISKACPKRYCICGKRIRFFETPCPYCGFTLEVTKDLILKLDQGLNRREVYALNE